jgi:hypothetical protein
VRLHHDDEPTRSNSTAPPEFLSCSVPSAPADTARPARRAARRHRSRRKDAPSQAPGWRQMRALGALRSTSRRGVVWSFAWESKEGAWRSADPSRRLAVAAATAVLPAAFVPHNPRTASIIVLVEDASGRPRPDRGCTARRDRAESRPAGPARCPHTTRTSGATGRTTTHGCARYIRPRTRPPPAAQRSSTSAGTAEAATWWTWNTSRDDPQPGQAGLAADTARHPIPPTPTPLDPHRQAVK